MKLTETIENLSNELAEKGRVNVAGFGVFTVKDKPERPGRNPQTGEAIIISARKSVSFKPAPKLKAKLAA